MLGETRQEELLYIYRLMYRSRVFQKKLSELGEAGLIPGSLYMEIGEEAVTIGSCLGVRSDDIIFPHFRGEGIWLEVRGVSLGELMAGWLGKKGQSDSVEQVKPTMWTIPNLSIYSRSDSILGTEIDQSTGIALALKLQKDPRVVVSCFGDGTSNRGNFHEALTFASVQKLPIVYVCRNNGWAMSMPTSRGVPVNDIAQRAESYSMPGRIVDGNDVLEVKEAVQEAAERARKGYGPTLIEAKTYRLSGHSAHDEDDYRPKGEKERWAKRDPLIKLERQLSNLGVAKRDIQRIQGECEQEVEEAYEWAANRPSVTIEELKAKQKQIVANMWGGSVDGAAN